MRRLLYSITMIMALLPHAVSAQDGQTAPAMSLQDCLNFALKNQARMKNAYLDQQSTLARNKEITGLALPKVSAAASINYAPLVAAFLVPNFIKLSVAGLPTVPGSGLVQTPYLNDAIVNDPSTDFLPLAFQPRWTTNPVVEASQVLFDPSVLVALQARKKVEELAQKNVNLTEQEVRFNVTKAYYDILIAEKRKGIIDQNLIRITQIEEETRIIYQNGLAEKLDVDRLTVALNNLKTEQVRIQQLVGITYMALKFQMGMQLETPIALTDTLTDDELGRDLLGHSFNISNRKEYQLLELQKDLSAYDLKRYKLGGLPTLAAYGNYGYTLYNQTRLFDPADTWQKTAMIGVKLTVPIFDGFQRKNKARQALYTLQKNENDLMNLRLGLGLETESARITLQSNLAALENQKANMALAEAVYNTSSIKYREGVGTNLEVLDAESALKEAQVNYFSALYDAITARINLLKALGEF